MKLAQRVVVFLALLAGSAGALVAGVEVGTLAGPLDGAVGGVAVDALGFVYVADFGETVWKISPQGEVEVFADTLYGASGNAIDGEGNLLQSSFNAGTVMRIARDGSAEVIARGLAGPVGITVDADGGIYVCGCSANVIYRLREESPPGEPGFEVFASGDAFNCPNGLTRDAEGNLYVANFADGRVIEIDPEGETRVVAVVPGGGNGHLVAVGDELYVTALRANALFRIDAEGTVHPFAGTGAFGQQDGPAGQAIFSTPNGIAYDPRRDALYVNDYLLTWSERWGGRTPPLSSVREILFPTLEETAREAFAALGAEATREAVRRYAATRTNRPWPFVLNQVGYALLQGGETGAALAVFEVASELFPASANAWDSLAEAHRAAGNRERAIELYEKSLALDPGNANAAAMIEEIRGEDG